MRKHFYPRPSETVQTYLFNSRIQRQGKSVSMRVAKLKKLAEFCNFRETFKPMFHDHIIFEQYYKNESGRHSGKLLNRDGPCAMLLVLIHCSKTL